jgi:enamine deaminase RidA (YjgF/YER057c/UK114 family)
MNTSSEAVNPWTWQDQFGFSQAVIVPSPSRWVFCAGQSSVDPDGNVLHPGDIGAQLTQSFDNLETVLNQAGTGLANVVRLNFHATEVDELLGVWHIITERLSAVACRPALTLLGVTCFAFPDLLLEIEATAFVP